MNWLFKKSFILFVFSVLFLNTSFAVQGSPQAFTFQGRLFNAAGTDPLTEVVTLKFQILDPSATCLLYQETQNVDLTNTSGVFGVNVGSAIGAVKRTAGTDPGLSMAQIFKNDSTVQTRSTHATCTGGYTPAVGDVRLLRVIVTPQSTGTPETLSPDQVINSVPQAIVAETLQGLTPSDFVQKDPIYITDANLKKIFGSLVDGVVDASTLHTHDDRYVQISSSSSQNLGSGGFNTSGKGSVGTSTNFTSTTMSVKADSDTNVGIAIRASSGGQSADLLQVQNSAGVKLAGISATGGLAATNSTITSTAGNQLVVKYDNTNTQTLDVSSSGTSTFTASGSSPQFGFLGGSVGIGTSTPSRALHVSSSSAPTVLLENTSGGADQKKRYTTTTTSGDMAWGKFSDDLATTTEQMRLLSNGALGIGVTAPTALLHLKAGTATANTAPLKFNTGVLLTTPENGAFEYDGTDYYVTSGGTRKKLSTSSGSGDFTSLTNSSGALSISSGGTNQNLTLSSSGTGSVTTASTTRITNTTSSTSSSTGALVVSGGAGFAGNVFSGGGFFSPLGSASAPTFGFAGDSDTGVFSPAADTWGVATAGSERIRIDSAGRVGIGTNSPGAKFEVAGTGGSLFIDNYQISSNRNPINGAVVDSSKGSASMVLATSASGGNIQFWNNAATGGTVSEKMRISEAGYVGIGTTSPIQALDLGTGKMAGGTYSATRRVILDLSNNAGLPQAGFNFPAGGTFQNGEQSIVGTNDITMQAVPATIAGYGYFETWGGAGSVVGTGNATPILFRPNRTEVMRITSGGNVGIGTSSPTATLVVKGSDNLSTSNSLVIQNAAGTALLTVNNGGSSYNTISSGGISSPNNGFYTTTGRGFYWDNSLSFIRGDGATGGTTNYISFHTNSTERARFDNFGNFGIGTTTPETYLHVQKNNAGGLGANLVLTNNGDTLNTAVAIDFGLDPTTTAAGAGNAQIKAIMTSNGGGGARGADLTFSTWSDSAFNEVLRLSKQANVGIGTINPVNKLSVSPLYYSTGSASQSGNTVTGTGTTWTSSMVGSQLVYANGVSAGTITAFGSSTSLTVSTSQTVSSQNYTINYTGLQVTSTGNVGVGITNPAATLSVFSGNADLITVGRSSFNTWTFRNSHGGLGIDNNSLIIKPIQIGGVASDFAVKTTAPDSGSPDLVVKSGGNVGVGLATPQTKFQVEGIISPATNNAYTLGSSTYRFTEVYATNGTVNTSDIREKDSIQNSDLGLDFINKLRPVSYRWKTGIDQDTHYGLIAQEAESIVGNKTSIVTYDKKADRYGVRYTELIAPLIKAIQEIYAQLVKKNEEDKKIERKIATEIHQLTKETQRLKKENDKLKEENTLIKEYLCSKDPKARICHRLE